MESLLLLFLGGFALLFLFFSRDYNPTAALFPRLVAIAALLFLLLDLFSSRGESRRESDAENGAPADPDSAAWLPAIALQAGYIAGIYVIGFSAATFLFLLAAPWQLRYRRSSIIGIHAALLTLAIFASFHWLFHVRLPRGFIGLPW